jgi:hypothetical protein
VKLRNSGFSLAAEIRARFLMPRDHDWSRGGRFEVTLDGTPIFEKSS